MILRPLNVKKMEEGHGIYEYRGPKLYFDENSMELYPVKNNEKKVLQDIEKSIPMSEMENPKNIEKQNLKREILENKVNEEIKQDSKKKFLYLGAGLLALRFFIK